jgi:hypothetical protein
LGRLCVVVVADLREEALLPSAAIDERHILQLKRDQRIRVAKVRQDRLWMLLRIAHNVRHPRLLPTGILCSVTPLAALRTNIVRLLHCLRPARRSDCKQTHHHQPQL